MISTTPIRFAIVGCGYIANRHAEHVRAHPDARLVAAYDIVPDRTTAFCARHGAQGASSIDELLARADVDIVTICTPNGHHASGAIAALTHGKHALVEKPMALSVAECERMLDAALRHGKQLFVVKQNRFNPPVAAVKKLLDEGRLGAVYAVVVNCFWNRGAAYYQGSDWKGTRALDGGTLFTQFSHFVDILYYLFGDMDEVRGVVANVGHQGQIEFEDSGFFHFRLKSGVVGSFNYTTSAFERNMEGSVTIFAERAALKIGGQYLNTIDCHRPSSLELSDLPPSAPANDYGSYQGSMSNHDKVIHNVVRALQGRDAIVANALEGMKVVEIIEKMYRSVR